MSKKAFTMMELVIALAIVAILVMVTIPLAKNKMDKVDRFSYYVGFATVQDIAANIVAQTTYDYDWNKYDEIPKTLDTVKTLCEKIKKDYNISSSDCNVTAGQMKTRLISGFKEVTPHIKLSNGLSVYIASDLVKIDNLDDAIDVRDRVGYLLYVDVNGSKKGKGILYQDVYPFYILVTGKILPLYKADGVGGANNAENLSVNVLYDNYSTGNRVVKASQINVSYQTGACATRYIQSAKYCRSIPVDGSCTDANADCRFIVNKPMKFFGR